MPDGYVENFEPRDFLALVGYNPTTRLVLYASCTALLLLLIAGTVIHFHVQQRRVSRSVAGVTFRSRPVGAERLLCASLFALLVAIGITFMYNGYDSAHQGQLLSNQCDSILLQGVQKDAQAMAEHTLAVWEDVCSHLQSSVGVSAALQGTGQLPIDDILEDPAQRGALVRQLLRYGNAFLDTLRFELTIGYVSATGVYLQIHMNATSGAPILTANLLPNASAPAAPAHVLTAYTATSSGVVTEELYTLPLHLDPFYRMLQRALRGNLPSASTAVHLVTLADGTAGLFTTQLVQTPAGIVLGLWFAGVDVSVLQDVLWPPGELAVIPGVAVGALMADRGEQVVATLPALNLNVSTLMPLAAVPQPTLAALGQFLNGSIPRNFQWVDENGTVWQVVTTSTMGPAKFSYIVAVSYSEALTMFNPLSDFEDIVWWSAGIDIFLCGVYGLAMISGCAFYVCWLMLRPRNGLEVPSQILVLCVLVLLVAVVVAADQIISRKLDRGWVDAFNSACLVAVSNQTATDLAFAALVSARRVFNTLRTAPLVNALLSSAARDGDLNVTGLDFTASEIRSLQEYQFALLEAYASVWSVYAGGEEMYFGYENDTGTILTFESDPYTTLCPNDTFGSALSDVVYYVANATGSPTGTEVTRNDYFFLQESPWWVAGSAHESRSVATISVSAVSVSRFVPSPRGTWGMVAGVDVLWPTIAHAFDLFNAAQFGTIYAATSSGQLLACNTDIATEQNGHDVYIDEVMDPAIQASFGAWQAEYLKSNSTSSVLLNFTAANAFSDPDEDGGTEAFLCNGIGLEARSATMFSDLDLVVINVVSFTDVYQAVSVIHATAPPAGPILVWRALFLASGFATALLFAAAYATVMGWIRWDAVTAKKTLNLVAKMLAESEPVANRTAPLSTCMPTQSVISFCLALPNSAPKLIAPPPSMGSIHRMLATSERCLQRPDASERIEACGLSHDEALAICIYTYEMQESSTAVYWLSSATSRFQIYAELNAALRSEDPELIAFWHPLTHAMVSGLCKMQRVPPPSRSHSRGRLSRVKNWVSCRCWTRCWGGLPRMLNRIGIDSNTGFLFRGLSLSAQLYRVGHQVVWPGFSSCTGALQVAKAFCDHREPGEGAERTMFFVEAAGAVRIAELSHFPGEEEALLLPGTVFQVVQCGCDKFSVYTNAVRFVELQELKDAPEPPDAELLDPSKQDEDVAVRRSFSSSDGSPRPASDLHLTPTPFPVPIVHPPGVPPPSLLTNPLHQRLSPGLNPALLAKR